MARVALGPAGDAAADAGLGWVDGPVVHRVVGVDAPAEQVAVELLQRLAVAAGDLEMRDAIGHAPRLRRPQRSCSYTRHVLTMRPFIARSPRFMPRLVSRIHPASPCCIRECSAASKWARNSAGPAPVCWNSGLTPRKPTRTWSTIRLRRR